MRKEAALIILQGQTMGTDYTVKYIDWADGRALPSPAAIKAQIERRLHEVNAEMSPYLPDSAISQFNQLRDDRWFLLPPDFATVLREAVALHEVTQGGLDVSLGALVNLWGFGPEPRRDSPPPPDAIAARTSGMGQFELAEESGMWFVRKHAPLLQLDLCAIAKGYGVDAVAGVLAAADIGDFLVEIGGELYGRGVNPQRQPWRVGVEHPLQRTQHVAVVALDGLALATSGDYRNFLSMITARCSRTCWIRAAAVRCGTRLPRCRCWRQRRWQRMASLPGCMRLVLRQRWRWQRSTISRFV